MNTHMSTIVAEFFGTAFAADWEQACRGDAELNGLGARAGVCFTVQAGAVASALEFVDGRLVGIRPGAERAAFTLQAPPAVWERFLQAVPPAPYHHVLAMGGTARLAMASPPRR